MNPVCEHHLCNCTFEQVGGGDPDEIRMEWVCPNCDYLAYLDKYPGLVECDGKSLVKRPIAPPFYVEAA